MLKDEPPEQLLAAVRTVARGEALLSPVVTRQVIAALLPSRIEPRPRRGGDLTQRELDVYRLITQGLSNAEIGERALHQRDHGQDPRHPPPPEAGVRDRAQAIVLAYQSGLFTHDVS